MATYTLYVIFVRFFCSAQFGLLSEQAWVIYVNPVSGLCFEME